MDRHRLGRKKTTRKFVFERDNFTCQQCKWRPYVPDDYDGSQRLGTNRKFLTVDHIVEKSLGGPSHRDNFQTLCSTCNTKKSVHICKLIREAQERGLSLSEAREHAAIRLGYREA